MCVLLQLKVIGIMSDMSTTVLHRQAHTHIATHTHTHIHTHVHTYTGFNQERIIGGEYWIGVD